MVTKPDDLPDAKEGSFVLEEPRRRDFISLAGISLGVVGSGAIGSALVDYMNPSADVLSAASTEVDLSPLSEGQAITVIWRGKPVFIRWRTQEEIEQARSVDLADLRDPQPDSERAVKSEWLVVIGVCTHLGCVPQGQKATDPRGKYNGWFCPCHGSHYDIAGRIRQGPAPRNLDVPPYTFISDSLIRIG